jgi:DNA-binding PadR family transcriptional regulator
MSLRHVLLVVLTKQPASGYDITKWFDGPLGHFWNTNHQRVYRALATLHEQGWVNFHTVEQTDRPDKKVYHITPKGEAALAKWMATPVKPTPINEPLLVKMFAGGDPDVLLAELKSAQSQAQELLIEYGQIEKRSFPEGFTGQTSNDLPYLTLRRGILYQQCTLNWLDEAIKTIKPHAKK